MSLPPAFQETVKNLGSMSPQSLDVLKASLGRLPKTLTGAQLVEAVVKATGLPEDKVGRILDFLVSVYTSQEMEPDARTRILKDVQQAISEADEASQNRVATLVNDAMRLQDGFGPVAKAIGLRNDNPSVLGASRIITDIRPSFVPFGTKVMGATVQHTVRLSCSETEGQVDLYLTASEEQLRKLRTAIERALAKGDELRKTFDKVPFVDG